MSIEEANKKADGLVHQALEILGINYGVTPQLIEACLGEDSELLESFNTIISRGISKLKKETL